MSKKHGGGNRKRIAKVKKKPQKKVAGRPVGTASDRPTPNSPATFGNLQSMHSKISDEINRAIKNLELRYRMEFSTLQQDLNLMKANQITLQTILKEYELVDQKAFMDKFNEYMKTKVGLIYDGRMEGVTVIEMFNVGKPPIETCPITEHAGQGPATILNM